MLIFHSEFFKKNNGQKKKKKKKKKIERLRGMFDKGIQHGAAYHREKSMAAPWAARVVTNKYSYQITK